MPTSDAGRPIRIFVVDDHPMLREGVIAVLEAEPGCEVAGQASNGAEAVEAFRKLVPDVTLMDLQMPGMDGIETIQTIRSEFPEARIIVLTTYAGDVQALRALKAGASGYLLKSALRKDLIDTIRKVYGGRKHIPPEIAEQIAFHAADESLSGRETGILQLVAAGKANKEIARQLSISEETVKAHLKNIFAKLGVTDRTEAVITAARRGIIEI
ncbi:MAG TPA: response regulator transcription factor [Rhizomicrobium sp.]|nr:response regulator transcription factor [Rhizomicrobium sp.]